MIRIGISFDLPLDLDRPDAEARQRQGRAERDAEQDHREGPDHVHASREITVSVKPRKKPASEPEDDRQHRGDQRRRRRRSAASCGPRRAAAPRCRGRWCRRPGRTRPATSGRSARRRARPRPSSCRRPRSGRTGGSCSGSVWATWSAHSGAARQIEHEQHERAPNASGDPVAPQAPEREPPGPEPGRVAAPSLLLERRRALERELGGRLDGHGHVRLTRAGGRVGPPARDVAYFRQNSEPVVLVHRVARRRSSRRPCAPRRTSSTPRYP